jgi:hypothetical protein
MLYGKKWSDEEENKLLECIEKNKTFVEIANELERTTRAIEYRVCFKAYKYMEEENKSLEEACSKFKLNDKTLTKYINIKNVKDLDKNLPSVKKGRKSKVSEQLSNDTEQYKTIITLLNEIKELLQK